MRVGGKGVLLISLCVAALGLLYPGCSLPNLEKPECSAARDAVRRFYSFHFAGDMKPTADSIKASQPYLTEDLYRSLSSGPVTPVDYFTQTDDYPRTFKIGTCQLVSQDHASLSVTLLWRDDTRTQQREVKVDTVHSGESWLINKIN
jgi:hypothetical protein